MYIHVYIRILKNSSKKVLYIFEPEITMFLLLMNEFHIELEFPSHLVKNINILSWSIFEEIQWICDMQ